jgi:hypothetical protein
VSGVAGRRCRGGLRHSFRGRKKIAGTERARSHRSEFTTCAGPDAPPFRHVVHIHVAPHHDLSHSSHHEVGVCASFGIIDWRRLAAIGGGDTFANDTLGSEA